MDCTSSPGDLMYPSSASAPFCTTQSDPANRGPSLADESPIMAMSPQQMPPHQDRHSLMEHYPPRLPPSPSYSPHPQVSSYASSEPLACIEPHVPSQQLVARQQTWDAPQASGWAGDEPVHAFSDAGAQRGLHWSNFGHGIVQPWMCPEQYPQVAFGGQPAYPQPLYPATTEQLHSYSQGQPSVTAENEPYYVYPSMSPGVSQTAGFSLGDASSASVSTFPGPPPYPGTDFGPPASPLAAGHPVATAPTSSQSSSPQLAHDQDRRMQSPATPASHVCDEPNAGHYAEAEVAPASVSPSGTQGTRATSSVAAEPNGTPETPYAQLIYQALLSRPRHAMRLQEIYQWFLENTNKGQDGTKGWQNSIRHNLSMNGAFERRPINGDANDSGDECPSPSNVHKQAAEWVLLDSAVKNGLQSTTRYRNSTRRGQTNRSRGRSTWAQRTARKPSRTQLAARSTVVGYSLPALPRSFRRHDHHRLHGNHGQFRPQSDSLAEQMERSSLDEQRRAMYFAGGNDYDYYHATHSNYASPPLIYSPELFMPPAQGAPTVVSDSDDNEAMTPEASFAALEPTVLLPGDNSSGTPGPTSDPYSRGPSAYYSSSNAADSHTAPRYTMGEVASVVDENTLRCCGWNGNTPSRQ